MSHTRAATLHMRPKVNDTFVSNFREPILTLIEDTSGIHDTLIAACDPARYKGLGVDKWEVSHSCFLLSKSSVFNKDTGTRVLRRKPRPRPRRA